METSEILDFPRIELQKIEDNAVELSVSGRAPRVFEADTLENAVEQGSAEVAQVAHSLGRPVKAKLIIDKAIRNTVVYPDGHAEILSQEYIKDKQPFYKKPLIICPIIAALLLGGGVTAWAITSSQEQPEVVSTAEATPQNITVGEGVQNAFYPLLSADNRFIIHATDKELIINDAQSGEEKGKVDISDAPKDVAVRAYKGNGFIFTWGNHLATWTEQDGVSSSKSFPSGQNQLVTRAGETAEISKSNAAQPSSVEVDNQAFLSPQKGASFLYVKDGKAYWASSDEGGSIITANSSGAEQERKKLASPSESAKLKTWAGVSANGDILTLWTSGNQSILAEQAPNSDAVSQKVTVASADSINVTQSGNLALVGKQIVDLSNMEVTELATAPENITPKVSGFIADSAGAKAFIDKAGTHTTKTGVLVGYNADSTPIILDNQKLIIDLENSHV